MNKEKFIQEINDHLAIKTFKLLQTSRSSFFLNDITQELDIVFLKEALMVIDNIPQTMPPSSVELRNDYTLEFTWMVAEFSGIHLILFKNDIHYELIEKGHTVAFGTLSAKALYEILYACKILKENDQ